MFMSPSSNRTSSKSTGGRKASSDVAQVNHKNLAFATVVVDLVENERGAARLTSGAAAVEISNITARKGINHAMESETPQRCIGVGSIGGMDGEFYIIFFSDGNEMTVDFAEAFPPLFEFLKVWRFREDLLSIHGFPHAMCSRRDARNCNGSLFR